MPPTRYNRRGIPSRELQRVSSLGDDDFAPTQSPALYQPQPASPNYHSLVPDYDGDTDLREYTRIPAWYTVSIQLGGAAGDTSSNSKQLRPERFVLGRITYATTSDVDLSTTSGFMGSSIQARCVELEWMDEFTRFMGNNATLVAALFGDSNGFLDCPAGLLFQGKQSLTVKLTRVQEAQSEEDAGRWDFVFHGLGLLPPPHQSSGSAR